MHRWQLGTSWEADCWRPVLSQVSWPYKTVVDIDIDILFCNKAIKAMLFFVLFWCTSMHWILECHFVGSKKLGNGASASLGSSAAVPINWKNICNNWNDNIVEKYVCGGQWHIFKQLICANHLFRSVFCDKSVTIESSVNFPYYLVK
jgi:hypothetical protein